MITGNTDIVIRGISAVVPQQVILTSSFGDIFSEKKVKMQERVTGIRQRHVASETEETKHLCLQAARNLLQEMQIPKEEIKVMLLVTQTPSYVTPSTAFWIHKELGLKPDCIVFDINLGCSGFVEGLSTMAALLNGLPEGAKGLLLNGDTLSKYLAAEDFGTCMMFGDAGTATLVERKENRPFICYHNVKSIGLQKLIVSDTNSKLYMDGMEVFNFTINDVVEQIQNLLKEQNDTLDFYLLHQAQEYIVRNIRELCGLEEEKVLCGYEKYGNTSGASIPLAICENRERFLEKARFRILTSGFGVGLSYATAVVEMEDLTVLPIEIYVKDDGGM